MAKMNIEIKRIEKYSYYEILYLTSIGMLWNGLKTNIKQQGNV